MRFFKHISLLAFFILNLTGCTSFMTDSYQEESRKVINYLLADMPLPDDAEIQKTPTVILGTGLSLIHI